jgi:hypothetical protein
MIISAVFVISGAFLGIFIIKNPKNVSSIHQENENKLPNNYFIEKYHLIKSQLFIVMKVLTSKELLYFTIWWTIGNCVFTVNTIEK